MKRKQLSDKFNVNPELIVSNPEFKTKFKKTVFANSFRMRIPSAFLNFIGDIRHSSLP